LHCIDSGTAILAHLPQARIEEIIARHGLPARTPNTITDPEELFEEIDEIPRRNTGFNDVEKIEGLRAVGAPIRNDPGEVLGSISASGHTSATKGERFRTEIPEAGSNVANTIELNIRVEQDSIDDVTY
jgi:DNA-binding IclR family transcriptional regulator